jgi:hypothetical protein
MACAAIGSDLAAVLEQVRTKAPCSSAGDLADALPEIFAAVHRTWKVDLAEHPLTSVPPNPWHIDEVLCASGIVYTYSTCVSAEKFLASLDTGGFDSIACESDGLRSLDLVMKASVSHDRRTLRVSVYQSSSRTGFDGIVKLRKQAQWLQS